MKLRFSPRAGSVSDGFAHFDIDGVGRDGSSLTQSERNHSLYVRNRVQSVFPTLVERLREAGYYQGVTHKLHLGPVEKFPYDEFLAHNDRSTVKAFIERATNAGKPWHLFYNISNSHRPFPNSDKTKLRVLSEMDPQSLDGRVLPLELYDLQSDADEMTNLAEHLEHRETLVRLYGALLLWAQDTADASIMPMPSLP